MDSGAEANVVNETTFHRIRPEPKLKHTSVKLKTNKSSPIPVKGYFMANLATRNGKSKVEARIYVTQGHSGKNLLGRYTAFDLGILNINLKHVGTTDQKATTVQHISYAEMSRHLTPLSTCTEKMKDVPTSDKLGENAAVKHLKQQFSRVNW